MAPAAGYAHGPDEPNAYRPAGGIVERPGVGEPDALMRLWAPHRMAYHGSLDEESEDRGERACPFCQIPTRSDEDGLVVARGQHVYAVLNLYPYNPGHLLVCPYRHVADVTDLSPAERAEMTDMTADGVTAVRAASHPDGFNVGFNLGAVSGGSVNDHLHAHVVPRWQGDAGFITVIGTTKALPVLLAETWRLVVSAWPDSRQDRTDAGEPAN